MARNIADNTVPGDVVMATMGAAHDSSVVPYSKVLSAEANADVIVVNTIDTTGINAAFSSDEGKAEIKLMASRMF